MAFEIVKFLKGILIKTEDTFSPKAIEIIPDGTADTKTTVTSSQTIDQVLTLPDATDTLVAKNTTDLLTNKSLQDTTTAIVDNLDPTKKIMFDAEGSAMTTTLIVSSPTVDRTLMLPDATDTLVARDTTDTLTNKTLTAPVIDTPDIDLGTIDGTDINSSPIGQTTPAAGAFTTLSGTSIDVAGDSVVTLTATQTVTNKTLTAPTIDNPVVTGGTINDTVIGNLTPDAATFTTINATSLDTTGNVVVGGDLTVNGTTTTLNTQTLDVEDSNITVNVNGNDISAEGSGLTIFRPSGNGSLIFKDSSPSRLASGLVGIEDNIVAENVPQTLTNKNLVDLNTAIVDNSDPTKRIIFDAAGTTNTFTRIATNATANRVVILPDATDTLVGKATTDTLTNKTLDYLRQSVLTDASTTGALATIPTPINGVIRLTNASLTTISGIAAGLSGQSVIIENVTGNSVDILNDDSNAFVGDKIYTGTEATVTLNNNATFVFTYDSTNQHWMLTGGSGSGTGSSGSEVNFIPNGNAEQTATPFAPFPFLASGGTARPSGVQTNFGGNFTAVRTLTDPLAGDASWLITKGASIVSLGTNIAIPFVVEPAYKAKSVKISFDYRVFSGTFQPGSNIGTVQDSTLIVYIYDLDNNVFIEPSNFRLLSNSTTIVDHFEAEFQTNAVSTNYQLLFSVAVSSATPCQLLVDNIAVSPNEYVFGTPVSDDRSVGTITISAVTTAPTKGTIVVDRIISARVGNRKFYEYEYEQSGAGTSGSGDYLISLPSGDSFDLNFITPFSGDDLNGAARELHKAYLGTGHIGSGSSRGAVALFAYDNTRFRVVATEAFANYNSFSSVFYSLISPVGFKFKFSAAISGLSSSVQMSDQTSTRVVSSAFFKNAGVVAANSDFTTYSGGSDTHGAFNPTTGLYTVPAPGDYSFQASVLTNLAPQVIAIRVNGVITNTSPSSANGTIGFSGTLRNLKTGDTIALHNNTGSSVTVGANNTNTYFHLQRLSGPSQIAASERISASYYLSANQATTANVTPILYNVKEFDTHNAYSTATGRFTAPAGGLYLVTTYHNGSAVSGPGIYKNGVSYKRIGLTVPGGSLNMGSGQIELLAGDFIEIRNDSNTTISGGTLAVGAATLSITRLGI